MAITNVPHTQNVNKSLLTVYRKQYGPLLLTSDLKLELSQNCSGTLKLGLLTRLQTL
jgi:hypothetical protein